MLKLLHGSRHDLKDGFSMDRSGSGFGSAGARGVGIYLSESPEVAEKYRAAGAGGILLDGLPLDKNPLFAAMEPPHLRGEVEILLRQAASLPNALKQARALIAARASNRQAQYASEAKQWRQAKDLLKEAKSVGVVPGHIYTVGVEVKPSELLDWELPLSEQSAFVQTALKKRGIARDAIAYRGGDPTGFDIMMSLKERKEETAWGPNFGRHTSEALLAAGIPGCRHDDHDLRKEGVLVNNYVIWDPARLKVLAKDGVPVLPRRKNPPLYHGTPNGPLTELKPGRAQLIFTSESRAYSALYGRTILGVELDVRNPADLDRDPKARALAIANFNRCNFRNTDDGFSPRFNPRKDDTWELAESPTFKEAMEAAGYDGAIFNETSMDGNIIARSHVAFHPEQVRVLPVKAKPHPETSLAITPVEPPGLPHPSAALPAGPDM